MAKSTVTVEDLRRSTRITLEQAGIESSEIESNILVCEAFGWASSELIAYAPNPAPLEGIECLNQMLARRIKHEPIAYILGKQPFWSLEFLVTPDVLIPRPETEGVVERALSCLKEIGNPLIVDVGTGSGAILLSVLHERKDATGVGLDVSASALDIAKLNADKLEMADRAQFVLSDFLSEFDQRADIIVSNPPYITDKAMKNLPRTVVDYEPEMALRGVRHGLSAYEAIIAKLTEALKPQGSIVFEIGYDQGEAVAGLLRAAGFTQILIDQDLAGHDRVVSGKISA
ncbi:MAG: peptide chain release factor N(5)-glutamine methyltransferase [Acidimicrobiales bacterium]|nr:peptide chain release factor N(5)-glutamine methyltransferase [Hyphomonadaceae bacterium]RZV43641.1 MAG: peptide chain release factor N(5)-glutamine methyltransferase [Acidimicrobiales bacterium]